MRKLLPQILWKVIILILLIAPVVSFADTTGRRKNYGKNAVIGKASWYSEFDRTDPWVHKFNADGSRFDENAFTCATRDRQFGRYYRVTNLQNSKTIVVLKRDFGPATRYKGKKLNRIIDLSKAAFRKIADLKQGVILVKVEAINPRLRLLP